MGRFSPQTGEEWMSRQQREVNRLLRRGKVGGSGSGSGVPAGTILPFAGFALPANALWCHGQAVSRVDYATLFSAIGTTFGTGDGSTTFNVPDLRGRVPAGRDSTQTEFDTLGEGGGSKTHAHPLSDAGQAQVSRGGSGWFLREAASVTWTPQRLFRGTDEVAATTRAVGAGLMGSTDSASSLQPYRVVNYIITTAAADLPGDSQLATRVGGLESLLAGVGPINNAFVAATGWSISDQGLIVRAGVASGWITFSRTGSAISVGPTGNITNQTVATTTDPKYHPRSIAPISGPLSAGPLVAGEIQPTNGTWRFAAIAPNNTINTGDNFQLGGTWMIDERNW